MEHILPPSSKRRKSRFAPSKRSPTNLPSKPKALSPTTEPSSAHPTESKIHSEAHPFENSSVALLRARTAASTRSQPVPNPPKRRRTRFSSAVPSGSAATAASPVVNAIAPIHSSWPSRLDVTSIPVAPVSTLRINRDVAQQRRVARVLRVSEEDLLDTDPSSNPYFDATLRVPHSGRRAPRPEFRFVQEGQIVAKAALHREQAVVQARTHQYRKQLLESGREADVLPVLPPLAEDLHAGSPASNVPEWEWWDSPFLESPVREGNPSLKDKIKAVIVVREDRITHYVHHPPSIAPATAKKPPPVMPLMLTKKETKKLRRQRRMEAHKEKQEMIAVGLLPPPPPKVKISNMMRVLATEASIDPTRIEADVRAQVEERRRTHESENVARKKSKEERHEKTHIKIMKDKEEGLHAAVFRISDMSDPHHRFKVDVNARQLELSGRLLLFPGCNIIVIEGGAKALRKYKKLLLRRINWNVEADNSPNEKQVLTEGDIQENDCVRASQKPNSCILVWEGPISSASFHGFHSFSGWTQKDCRYHFRKHGVEHYWDLCTQANPLGNENLGLRGVG